VTDAVPPLPVQVVDFIHKHVTSLLQLEALLLVFESGQRTRSAAQLAGEMYVPAEAISSWLDEFADTGFCERVDGGYRMSEEKRVYDLLADVADCYMRRRISVSRLIFSPRDDPKASFSDAFRLKKDR
jgi:hypothetical protein